ncbi:doublecortin domain-containing protein 2-like [Denticeps clupeoides]|uniref:Doublecortin domain-containing protein 2 n=1 Tax=Denticeps clupeoides TaxID=299321 RepID=A0AAY4ESE2_9TELE|nr:doublecortin domain-containing protein 2 [Denticeps clupeoides]
MSTERPNFLSQPAVKNVFLFRNGDPHYEARRLVINEKRVSNFETFLREVTSGVRAPFGAVRNIYTPRAGHRVDQLDLLRSGEQYVAAGQERFKKLDYKQIGSRKKRMLLRSGQAKTVPQNHIVVSPRFLKPIKEPCAIFVVANGDILNPAARLLIPHRVLGKFDRILEMITEKMGLKILGGVRRLYTFDGAPVTDGNELEKGQFYVAVGREKLKKLPYSDILFTRSIGIKKFYGTKAVSLPPIYSRKQNGNARTSSSQHSKSEGTCSEENDFKASPSTQRTKENSFSIVREFSQARLMTLRKKRSGLTASLEAEEKDDDAQNDDDANAHLHQTEENLTEETPHENGGHSLGDIGEEKPSTPETAEEATTEDAVGVASNTQEMDESEEETKENHHEETGEDEGKGEHTGPDQTDKSEETHEKAEEAEQEEAEQEEAEQEEAEAGNKEVVESEGTNTVVENGENSEDQGGTEGDGKGPGDAGGAEE